MVHLIKENRHYITEAKQVGDIYHVCSLDSMKFISWSDSLQSAKLNTNKLMGGDVVSFTRNKRFISWTLNDEKFLFQIEVDGNKLSENYKVTPYNDFVDHKEGTPLPSKTQFEECVVGPIHNFKKYIKSVNFMYTDDFFSTFKSEFDFNSFVNTLEDIEYYLDSIPTKRIAFPRDAEGYGKIITSYGKRTWSGKNLDVFKKFSTSKTPITLTEFINNLKDIASNEKDIQSERNHLIEVIKKGDIIQTGNLLNKGFDPNFVNKNGEVPIAIAVENGNIEIIELLDSHGVSYDVPDRFSDPLLLSAVYIPSSSRRLQTIEHLLSKGVNPNKRNKDGITALHAAASLGFKDIVSLLMSHGANPHIRDNYNKSPIDVAKNEDIRSILSSKKEMKVRDIFSKSDDGSKGRMDKIKAKFEKIIDKEVYFTTSSQTFPNIKTHIVIIKCNDISEDTSMEELKEILKTKDVKIACSCEAFLYHGFKYISYHADAGIDPENRPPNKTNPKRIGMACKHILSVFKYLGLI